MPIIIFLIILLFSFTSAEAVKIEVNPEDLDSQTLKKVITRQTEREKGDTLLAEADKYLEFGKRLGGAVDGALGAVVNQANVFGKTEVGRFTLFLVGWKLFGRDVIRYIFGFFFFIISLSCIIWSYWKLCVPRKILVGFDKTTKVKTYKIVNNVYNFKGDDDYSGSRSMASMAGTRGVHLVAFLVTIVITNLIFFAFN